jgi:hypothetical protein
MTKRRKSIDSKRKMVASNPVGAQPTSLPLVDSARPAQKLLKTPLFLATNASRYRRQNLIREIDHKCGTSLICFVVGEHREIERDDTLGFVDLLYNIRGDQAVDLMIHTVGGDVDAAQKLIALIHSRIEEKERFRVIVPEYAKSAGTLMALGGSTILMSDTSELGMIDPQYMLKDANGNEIWTSVVAYLQAYEQHSTAVNRDPEDRAAAAMLGRFDPVIIRKFQSQRDRASDIAMHMLNRLGANSSAITESLLDLDRWKSHGQVIGHADAREIGLNVSYLPPEDERWQLYWHLHCLQRLEVGKDKKLYESALVSQIFET